MCIELRSRSGTLVEYMRKMNESKKKDEVFDSVKLDSIPEFSKLKKKVDYVVKNSSWWDLYGVDWTLVAVMGFLFAVSLWLLRFDSWLTFFAGAFLYSLFHHSFATKCGHLAGHGSMCQNKKYSRPLAAFFIEFTGQFSEELAYDAHIKEHHPYTNVLGIGDSSTWKAPFLPRYIYMFIAPMLLPIVTPLVSVAGLLEKRAYFGLLKYIIRAGAGFALVTALFVKVSNYNTGSALLVIWFSRAILSIPYIHVNIFQHIGLPMYSKQNRPVRIYQMATGVLNLPSNPLLDYAFGHSIISCHVEHHLFPSLSDNMCLKIKPIVSKFLKENGLPYNEATYSNRLKLFIDKYETLMVNAPPITHFAGIQ